MKKKMSNKKNNEDIEVNEDILENMTPKEKSEYWISEAFKAGLIPSLGGIIDEDGRRYVNIAFKVPKVRFKDPWITIVQDEQNKEFFEIKKCPCGGLRCNGWNWYELGSIESSKLKISLLQQLGGR